VNLDLGASAAQSVVLMAVAITFTILQFRASTARSTTRCSQWDKHTLLSITCHALLIILERRRHRLHPDLLRLRCRFAHDGGVSQSPFPLLPGTHFIENAWMPGRGAISAACSSTRSSSRSASWWARSPSRCLRRSRSPTSAFRFRMTAFWLIFVSLMLPVEVRIIPTYEAVADAAGPLRWLVSVTGIGWLIETLFGITASSSSGTWSTPMPG
jgi:sn-glycerol 3-phosphate transport system permease protein